MYKLLSKLYYDPKSPVGYTGLQALYKAAKKISKKIKLDDVKNWLRKQQTYTLHKPIRRKFVRRKTVVAGIDYQWQGDLADVSNLAKYNDKYRYLFCLIDVFSKFAWVVPIKDKSGKTLVEAFKSVLKQGRFPKSLQTDKGTEFKNKEFQTFLKSQNIHFFYDRKSRNQSKHCRKVSKNSEKSHVEIFHSSSYAEIYRRSFKIGSRV